MNTNNKRKIVFLFHTPIPKSYLSLFKISDFLNLGYNIELIDTSYFSNRPAYNNTVTGLINYEEKYVHRVYTNIELFKLLDEYYDAVIIVTFDCLVEFFQLFRYLSKNRRDYGYLILGTSYQTASFMTTRKRISSFLYGLSFKRIANGLYRRLPRKKLGIKACDFIICNSPDEEADFRKRLVCDEHTTYKTIHSNFYEEALENKRKQRIVPEKYCVWLDFYAPYHPDVELISGKNRIDPAKYYNSLKQFFCWIEKYSGYKVVIAAHPRSDYEKHPESYNGFRIEKFKTSLLVRDAEFIMTSASTSFLYGVMYLKPIIFIIQDELYKLPKNITYCENTSKKLNKETINIDHIKEDEVSDILIEQMRIDNNCYIKSANSYIKVGFDGDIAGRSHIYDIIDFLESL